MGGEKWWVRSRILGVVKGKKNISIKIENDERNGCIENGKKLWRNVSKSFINFGLCISSRFSDRVKI